ncbi:MAG: bifunctional oligoribonuclease/PAP phosphatase NrnA [bacterium]
MITFSQLASLIKDNQKFVLTSHVNPDADAIGSELAFYYLLNKMNKEIKIINYSATPENLLFMDKNNIIEQYIADIHNEEINNCDVIVLLDLNSISRTKSMETVIRAAKKEMICVDHHEYPENFTQNILIDTNSCATGEIIYNFIENTNIIKLDYDIAYVLYAAIMTDTGSFRYERTTSKTHKIIAEFLDIGVIPKEIHEQIYDNSGYGKLKLLGEVLTTLHLNGAQNVSYMIITQKMIEQNEVDESEVDGFVNYCLSIKGVFIGLLFFELKDGFKVSLRSRGNVPVNLMAKKYGGGGHYFASGIRFTNEEMEKYIPLIIKEAEEYISKYQLGEKNV